jgi:hypothetical protein
MQSVQHITASKTAARAFVDSVLNPKALWLEHVPVDLNIAMLTVVSKKPRFASALK